MVKEASKPLLGHALPRLGRMMARPTGLEPVTFGLEVRCSIQLNYGRTKISGHTSAERGRFSYRPSISAYLCGVRTHWSVLVERVRRGEGSPRPPFGLITEVIDAWTPAPGQEENDMAADFFRHWWLVSERS